MIQNSFMSIGLITHISELLHFNNENAGELNKKMITIKLEDNQVIIGELRNENLPQLANISVSDTIQFTFTHHARVKGTRRYNNIHLHQLKKI